MDMNTTRIEKLTKEIESAGLDCLALVPGTNLYYLTGLEFKLGDRPTLSLFIPGRRPALILPVLETLKAEELDVQIFPWRDDAGYESAFKQAGAELGLDGMRIGVEAFTMRVVERNLLAGMAGTGDLVPADSVPGKLRIRKDSSEIEIIRKAANIAQKALLATLDDFKPGMTERQLAARIKIALLEANSEDMAFSPLISSGPNCANPHGSPTDRPVMPGDMLLFDWGAVFDHYISDITRTFPVGQVDPEMRTVYQLVQEANAAGRAAARPGVTSHQVDTAVREVIEKGGYGEFFFHRNGHGIGLEVHEHPDIVQGSQLVLEPGMTFTIEPGVYLASKNGVRIEDDVVVTEDGCESLSTLPRDWSPIE
jgi:Xaa-Pro dipeptidase